MIVQDPLRTEDVCDDDIVSQCGLLCNTCAAYLTRACPGCPWLEQGECILRDCAEAKGTRCPDCQAPACYHFEVYPIRRRLMNTRARQYLQLTREAPGADRSDAGGCGCCAQQEEAPGCPAARIAERLARV